MKILFVSLLAGSAQGILAADADADDNADAGVPAASLRRRGTATNHANRRTNGYWAAPISDSGLTCIDNSIRAGGDKPAEICMTEGDALCIEYDHKPMGGRWQFGIKDSRLLLYDPKGDVAWEYCRDVTHLCIGEEHGFVPNRYSQERPYMTMYDEKSHEVVGSLTCDGTDGQDDKNLGQSTILKLVDQAVVGPYADFPLAIVKLRKGQTEDPEDDNSLWDIEYDPNEPHQRLWWENLADYDATFSYNQGKCEWTDLCPTNTPSSTPSVSFVPTTFCDNGDRVGTFRELKEQIDEATDPDPANRAKIEICSNKPIVFDSIVDISDKYFDIVCHESDDCVLDLDGYSFVTPYPGSIPGKEFYAGFEGVIIENGSTGKGRDEPYNDVNDGGAFALYGAWPNSAPTWPNSTLALKNCTLRNNVASGKGGVFLLRDTTLDASNSVFTNNVAQSYGGVMFTKTRAFSDKGYASFANCRFEQNVAGEDGGAIDVQHPVLFEDSDFVENSAGDTGGAISLAGYRNTIKNCQFERNSAGDYGGAVSAINNFVLQDSRFLNNTATKVGGAISIGGFETSGLINNCLFKDNKAGGDGGAFTVKRANEVEMTNCTFQSNTASSSGGAVHVVESPRSSSIGGDLIAVDCKFMANSAPFGGALATFWNTTLHNCQFEGNNADAAGAIFSNPEKVGPYDIVSSYKGQRTLISGADTLFKSNAASKASAGAIMHFGGKFEMSDAEFVANTAQAFGGGIQFENAEVVLNNCRLEQNALVGNSGQSGGGGGGIALSSTNMTMENTVFQGNSIANGKDGGAILAIGSAHDLTLTNCAFRNNTASNGGNGGAIYTKSVSVNLQECNFSDNIAVAQNAEGPPEGNGGAIAFGKLFEESGGELNVRDTIFSNNRGRIGGAIYNTKGVTTISGCQFVGNKGASGSGAIRTEGTTNINSSNFTGNVGNGGGAITARSELTVQSTLFKCNDGDGFNGGAIYVTNRNSNLNMDDVEFSANTAASGGAVYFGNLNPVAASEFNNCRFYQNTANIGGGAIFFRPMSNPDPNPSLNVTLNRCVFQDNTRNSNIENDLTKGIALSSFNEVQRAVQCGPGYGNCFCDTDNSTDISTNIPTTTCAGDGVGPTCPGCTPPAEPIVCPSLDVV